MMDFFTRLFDPSGFPPRWNCGAWTSSHGWLHILSDLGVWSAYVAIPFVLAYFVLRRRDIPFRNIFWLFGAFILACGTTHLMEAIIFWWPAYRLAGLIKLITALVSWGTVIALIPVVPEVLAMRGPEELMREIKARSDVETALQAANAELERQVQALRASEERFRLLVDGTKDHAIFMLDPTGRIVSWNPGAERITGYQVSDVIGQHFSCFYTPEDVESGKHVSALRLAETEGRYEEEGQRVRNDGTRFWASVVITALRDGAGKLTGFSKVTRDITKRKQAEDASRRLLEEEAARQAAEEYAQVIEREREQLREQAELLDLAHDAIMVHSTEGIITFWNQGAERMYGWPKEASLGQSSHTLLQTVFPIPLEEIQAELARTGWWEGTLRRTRRNGADIVVASRWALRRGPSDKAGSILEISYDLSQQRLAEEALRESEKRVRERAAELEAIMRATPTPIWIALDADCHQITGNPASFQFLRLPEGANVSATAPNRHPSERGFQEYREDEPIPPDQLPVQMAARGIQVNGAEVKFVFTDGKVRYLYGNAVPLANQDGSVRGSVAAFVDVTPLKEAAKTLKEADRRKNEFLATLAHELRNPLAPIRNAVELLRRANGDTSIAEQAQSIMERQVGQMVHLIDDLLDIARITSMKLHLRKELVPLAPVIQSAVEAALPVIEKQAHQLTLALPPEPIYLDGDPTRLAQIFANLLTNAAKYTEREGHIWLRADKQGREIAVSVQDTGIGIAPEHLPHVFEMFSQVAPALSRSQGGLGIGLALVQGLVELHGGAIEARSNGPGKGSEFIVRLPVVECRSLEDKQADGHTQEITSATRIRVLVADDNRDAVDSLAMMLRLMGHDVETAHDGVEAVQAAASLRPDIALLDIGMPKMNGYEAAHHIRQQPWGKNLVLVALTGWGQEEDKRRAIDAGFDHHLTKPVEPQLLEKLVSLMKRSG